MSFFREAFYSQTGNRLVRAFLSPVKSLIPAKFRFPVSGRLSIPIPGFSPLLLDVNPTCFLGKVLFWEGLGGFEPSVHRVFKALIRKSETFLDIGANVGFYSLLASKYNPGVRVHCFEPLPASFKYLMSNIQANGANMVQAHQMALSNKTGPTTFFYAINPKFPFVKDQLTSTGSLDESQANRTSKLEKARVEQIKLDEFVNTVQLGRIDLIKLDTEATEHLVMDGAKATIMAHRPIILCEVLPGKVEQEIQSRVESMKYAPFRITEDGLQRVHDLGHTNAQTNDYLFCPKEKLSVIEPLLASVESVKV